MADRVPVDAALLASLPLPDHDDDGDKNDRGCILVVGGSAETPGAVLLAGLAALRAGAGKLQLATVAPTASALAVAVPEARVVGLPVTDDGEIDGRGASEQLAELASRADAVLVGPGLLHPPAADALLAAVIGTPGLLVIDALATGAAGAAAARLRDREGRVVAVPNQSEMEVLGADDVVAAAQLLGAVVACRAPTTTLATPDGRTFVDATGNVGLATSGSGDVAAGLVAGLAARGADPLTAAVWGCHVHGRAGERLAAAIAPIGYLARELLDMVPGVFRDLAAPPR